VISFSAALALSISSMCKAVETVFFDRSATADGRQQHPAHTIKLARQLQ
jgi:hypothetical protein